MFTPSALKALRDRLGSTRTLSIYLSEDAEDPAGRTMGRRTLAHLLDHLQDDLKGASHEERAACEQAIAHAEQRLAAIPFSTRFAGWVAFVTATAVEYAEMVPVHMPTQVSWSNGPRLAPYVRVFEAEQRAAVAVMDSHTARLLLWNDGALVEQETLVTEPEVGSIDHMGAPPKVGFHSGTRGRSGTDVAEQEHRARLAEHVRLVADRLLTLATPNGLILVGGIPAVVQLTVSYLTTDRRARARALDGLDVHESTAGIATRAGESLGAWRTELAMTDLSGLTEQAHPGGLASFGATPTFAALRDGAVDRLLLSDRFLQRWSKDAEAAVQLALDTSAHLQCLTGEAGARLDAVGGGMAARLRFPVLTSRAPAGVEVHGGA